MSSSPKGLVHARLARLERRLRFFEIAVLLLSLGLTLVIWMDLRSPSARADDSPSENPLRRTGAKSEGPQEDRRCCGPDCIRGERRRTRSGGVSHARAPNRRSSLTAYYSGRRDRN